MIHRTNILFNRDLNEMTLKKRLYLKETKFKSVGSFFKKRSK